jgi:hypothetical protein
LLVSRECGIEAYSIYYQLFHKMGFEALDDVIKCLEEVLKNPLNE